MTTTIDSRITNTRARQRPATTASGRPDPIAHLTPDDIEEIGRRLDAIRDEVIASRGSADAAYIRTIIKTQRTIDLASRAVLLFSRYWPAWIIGTSGLAVAKILENTEIGHNILHGQWDWMRDPKIHSTTWEWDFASPAEHWKKSHNFGHHTYTNVIGKDDDLGYHIMRVSPDQPWQLSYLFQPLVNALNACFFEYGIAAYDLQTAEYFNGKKDPAEFKQELRKVLKKAAKQFGKDYLLFPALSGPSFVPTLLANMTANLVRNIWTHSVIICGHFPEGVETFEVDSIEGETRGEWYIRQMLGSANISGSKAMHIMTGNLSHQIEHHLFPDLPSNRYAQIAPKVRELMRQYQLRHVTGSLPRQVASAWGKVFRYALPNPSPQRSQWGQVADAARVEFGRAAASLANRVRNGRASRGRR